MSENKYCGNCKHFKDEDADGFVQCNRRQFKYRPCRDNEACEHHEFLNGGWTEITLDNVKEIESMLEDRVVVGCIVKGKMRIYTLSNFWFTPTAIAMQGGYYYYVLPELKIE